MAPLPDMKAKIKVVDVETTTQEGDPDWVHASNHTVLMGVLDPDWKVTDKAVLSNVARHVRANLELEEPQTPILMVGHNLSFDIGYLVKEKVITQDELAKRVQIWDTMVAEYILSCQYDRFITLENACAKRGIAFKKNAMIAKMFEEGKGAASVPLPELSEYLRGDIEAAYKLFLLQYEKAEEMGMLPLIQAMMDFRLATIDMRLNGIHLDPDALRNTEIICTEQINVEQVNVAAVHSNMQRFSEALYDKELRCANLDPLKWPQLSNLLFGGEYKKREDVLVGQYKNGKDKFKKVETWVPYVGLLSNLGITVPKEERSVDEDSLTELMERLRALPTSATGTAPSLFSLKVAALLEHVLAYRKAVKILSTYVAPSKLDAMRFGNKLYPTIHVTPTPTGRTSCSGPNLQNVPKKSLGLYRKAIVPPAMRKLVEFDYKQLEVIALAVLTKDAQLIADLKGGVDMHIELFRQVHGRVPNSEERTDFKRAVFCLIYGGGPDAIASQGNTTRSVASKLMVAFRARYPATMTFRERVLMEVEKDSWVSPVNKHGIPHRVGTYHSPTGRRYRFEQKVYEKVLYPSWKKEKRCDWSKQEIANYPVQGLATADIAPLMVGMLYRYVYSGRFDGAEFQRPRLLIPVHDSVLTDVDEGTLLRDVGLMKRFLEQVPEQMMAVFGLDCSGLPFKVGVSCGSNWEDMFDITKEK